MRLLQTLGLAPLLGALLAGLSVTQEQCDNGSDSQLLVGASVVSILPEVEASTAYFDEIRAAGPLALTPGQDPEEPGVFVEEWDVGTIAIGNGNPSSHWVHDEVRAGVVAFKDLTRDDDKILVMVSADVYMLFRQDMEEIFSRVIRYVGQPNFDRLHIVVSATHNHMGPDTSGLDAINPGYYRYMADQIAQAIVDAIDPDNMQPAELRVAQSEWQFGLSDATAPFIIDPTLNSMQAINPDTGEIIATMFQWQNHPEATLGWGKDVWATQEQADYLKSIDECFTEDGEHCHIEGQYISAGYPGYAAWRVMEETGAPAIYLNGAVGAMQTPLHATVWETQGATGVPVDDNINVPEGATPLSKNFHKLATIGNELGWKVLEDLTNPEIVVDPPITMVQKNFYTRLANWGFRVGMVVGPTGNPLMLGLNPRDLFNCESGVPHTDDTCVMDDYATYSDPYLGLPVRVGDFLKTEVHYLKIGPVGMITIPGEAVAEVVEGLPSDFLTDPRDTYYQTDDMKANHATGAAYSTSGYVRQAMNDRYKWVLGLTMDEAGYMVPLSDWRIYCMADEEDFGGSPDSCKSLYDNGIMDYEDYDGNTWSISGERCKTITDDPSQLELPPYSQVTGAAEWAQVSCLYGTTWNESDDHYEQTMSAGWDFTDDWTDTVKAVTAWEGDLEEVNPDFIGYNQE